MLASITRTRLQLMAMVMVMIMAIVTATATAIAIQSLLVIPYSAVCIMQMLQRTVRYTVTTPVQQVEVYASQQPQHRLLPA
jgi:hypothetical protein